MTAAPFHVEPLPASFGATVTGLRLATLPDGAFEALCRTWLEYGLLIFPRQFLSREEQATFARRLGPLEFAVAISNVREDGVLRPPDDAWVRVLRGSQRWHIDSTYMPVQSKGAILSAHVVTPEGGATEWADMAAAYDVLPEDLKARIAGLSAYHSLVESQARVGDCYRPGPEHGGYGYESPPQLRPLVKVHPDTGRRVLTIGRHAYGIPGLADAESDALLDELHDLACRPPRVWAHRWRPGDAVLWDNRRLMHRGEPWDLARPRILHHTRIAGDPRTELAQPA